MDDITHKDLSMLASPRKDIGVSIYMPFNDGAEGDLKNPAVLTEILDVAREKLLSSGVKSGVVTKLLQPGFDLVRDETYWRDKFVTLAFFLFVKEFHVYKLPSVYDKTTEFSRYPYIKPILRDYVDNKKLYVLVLEAGGSKLFKFDRYNHLDITPKVLEMSSKEYADKYFQIEREQSYHIKRQGGGKTREGLISHGHDNTEQLNKLRATEYARIVAKEVKKIVNKESFPMVLAGVKGGFLAPTFRAVYDGASLIDDYIQVETVPLNLGKILKEVSRIIGKMRVAEESASLEKVSGLLGTGYEENKSDQIVKRAFEGRVDTLFVNNEKDAFGIINNFNDLYEVQVTDNPEDEDLSNIAVATTWDKDGKVFFVSGSMIDNRPMMASLRY